MTAHARSGFTLIEILAVVLIVGILATILIFNLGEAKDAANVSMTRADLSKLESVIDAYENEFGDYPPSSFEPSSGVANEGNTNAGVECLVQSLWSKGWDAGGGLIQPDALVNTDGDQAGTTLGDLGRELPEFVDRWENPVAYLHNRDYEAKGRVYLTFDPETGREIESEPKAFRNETIGRFFNATKYQLISAGQDGEFGTEDDITTFDR